MHTSKKNNIVLKSQYNILNIMICCFMEIPLPSKGCLPCVEHLTENLQLLQYISVFLLMYID